MDDIKADLQQFLQAIARTASDAKDFTLEQAPLVAQEYIAWYTYSAAFTIAVAALACLAALVWAVVLWTTLSRDLGNHHPRDEDFWMPFILFGILPLLASCIPICIGAYQLIYVSVAPRLVILDKVQELLQAVH